MRPNVKKRRGISIAETLVGIFLVALLLTALFNLFPTTIVANRQGSNRLRAVNLAHSTLSEWRVKPFDQLVVGSTQTLPVESIGGVNFERKLLIEPAKFGDPKNVKILEVEVKWEAENQVRTITEDLWIHRLIEE